MRILFIQPAGYHGESIHHYMPPLGIATLAAVLRENGFEDVHIIDFRTRELWENRENLIRDINPDLVCITCMTTNFPNAARVASFCKNELSVPVVFGGPHASGDPESVLNFGHADAVLEGYSEKALLRLCEILRDGGSVSRAPGAVRLDSGSIRRNEPVENFHIDELPPPARDLLPIKDYTTYIDSPVHGRIDANTVAASRGCAYRCAFCISSVFRKWMGRRPDLVCDEIELLVEKYPQPGLFFYDLLFTVSPAWVRSLCDEMVRRGLDRLKWYAMGRLNVVDSDTLNSMSRAGCVLISYGVESLHDRFLRAINKDQTYEQIENGIRLTYEAGITPMAHFIVGLPGQSEDDIFSQLETVERWIKNYHFYPGDFYPMMIFPGTRLFDSETKWHQHNWIDTVSPDFIFPNVPIYSDLIPAERELELSEELNSRCRALLAETSNIYNTRVRPRKTNSDTRGKGTT
ncbi:MAG TPA: radical SAM protein [bacterium]|nr:radical SAM protein [bacterium]